MRVVLQRVSEASVRIGGETVGAIGPGLVVLAGFHNGDDDDTVAWMAEKVANLRIFGDDQGRMNRSLLDIGGEALVVSQFTLYGDARKGRRPSFIKAARPEIAVPLHESFVEALGRILPDPVQTGEFGAMMEVGLVNDGPVTLVIER
ncbi:MAG: D-tyrosyl-tRNA(Tyr) deacylase [Gemmatimonadetes bacterium]|nr:D-tyrosyl-tRNA(Tyr) deacylase [Gemmatimonadota bacterium]MYB97738.1 D-tyrosyl-tRNA(Tyr) deacylase [Gemmatimonadota bacterium]MYI45869.1 D-tyrosyl-tRNA(Tyr) deacylase [Gemmatimonadota bacterium]